MPTIYVTFAIEHLGNR